MKRTPLARKTPVKRVNKARKAENFDRAYGSPERVSWVQRQPCVCCGHTPSENAHVRTGGTSRKADACWIAPLCPNCHAELHRVGIKSFVAAHQIDLEQHAAITDARWAVHEIVTAHQTTKPPTPRDHP